LGKEDDRHLWPEMLRAIREIRPRYVVGENVRGIVSWSNGLVFEEVFTDLEGEGYEVQAFVLPAVGVNAPHKRDRVYFVAKDTGRNGCIQRKPQQEGAEVRQQRYASTRSTDGLHLQKGSFAKRARGHKNYWEKFPTQSPICSGDDGLPTGLDDTAFSKWRKQSIMGYGNAIVPQIAYRLFDTIQADSLSL